MLEVDTTTPQNQWQGGVWAERGPWETRIFTPPKFNIAPEKWWLEDYFLIGKATFQGLS